MSGELTWYRTEDGSYTLFTRRFGEHYHSVHGACQESRHIFIQAGLLFWLEQYRAAANQFACAAEDKVHPAVCRVFEAGFGTGLNAWLTVQAAAEAGFSCRYEAVEWYPLAPEDLPPWPDDALFAALHAAPWQTDVAVSPHMTLRKRKEDLTQMLPCGPFDVVYFDAFSPAVQPEMWTEEVFGRLFRSMAFGGVLVTYCAKGTVRRTLCATGFRVERLPGPPGKREMLRAVKR